MTSLTSIPESDLWAMRGSEDHIKVRNELARRYMPVMNLIAGKASRSFAGQVDIDDVRQDAFFGLCDAIEKFDPAKGVKFSTFIWRRIWGAVLDAQRERDWVPRLVRQRKETVPAVSSLSHVVFRTDMGLERQSADMLEDADTMAGIDRVDAADLADRLLRGMYDDDKLILRLYYGEGICMREIGKAMGLSESRISQRMGQIHEQLESRREEFAEYA